MIKLSTGEMEKMARLSNFVKAIYCAVNNITEEPDAVIPHVRICMGAAQQWVVLP